MKKTFYIACIIIAFLPIIILSPRILTENFDVYCMLLFMGITGFALFVENHCPEKFFKIEFRRKMQKKIAQRIIKREKERELFQKVYNEEKKKEESE